MAGLVAAQRKREPQRMRWGDHRAMLMATRFEKTTLLPSEAHGAYIHAWQLKLQLGSSITCL
jgi:hypothetical protein